MNTTHYPSDEEIRQRQGPELEFLRKATVFAEYDDPPTLPIRYRAVVGEKGFTGARPNGEPAPSVNLLDDHFHFLADIAGNPSEGIKRHYERLGWGIEKGNRILRELKAVGAVTVHEEKAARPTGGRARLVVTLTPSGRQMLDAYQRKTSAN